MSFLVFFCPSPKMAGGRWLLSGWPAGQPQGEGAVVMQHGVARIRREKGVEGRCGGGEVAARDGGRKGGGCRRQVRRGDPGADHSFLALGHGRVPVGWRRSGRLAPPGMPLVYGICGIGRNLANGGSAAPS